MPRFLLHHKIFDHGLIDGLGPDQPRQQGNLLCSEDWIQLRRICAHVSKKLLLTSAAQIANTSAREPAPRSAGPSGLTSAPCTQCPDSSSDSEPKHWLWGLDEAGGCCRSVLEPPLSLQPAVLFQPGLPLQGPPPQSLGRRQLGRTAHSEGIPWAAAVSWNFSLMAECRRAAPSPSSLCVAGPGFCASRKFSNIQSGRHRQRTSELMDGVCFACFDPKAGENRPREGVREIMR